MRVEERDLGAALCEQIVTARDNGTALAVRGGATKNFLGAAAHGAPLDLGGHCGIVAYEPSELVVTARAGTPLAALSALLAANGQMLGFEPPEFDGRATLGGAVASGLAGPRRPWVGAARDFVLGVCCITGNGEALRFGGRVIKNVAGYDLSRLMAGAMGVLGVLSEISLRVLPLPQAETTVVVRMERDAAHELLIAWAQRPMPLSAAAWDDGALRLRLSGAPGAVAAARAALPRHHDEEGAHYWHDLRELRLRFFRERGGLPLWRLSVPQAAPRLDLPGAQLMDWGGAQRWLLSDAPPAHIHETVAAHGGHATLFGGTNGGGAFSRPAPQLFALHRRLKQVFDPAGILNPGRLYPGL